VPSHLTERLEGRPILYVCAILRFARLRSTRMKVCGVLDSRKRIPSVK
jgi:hypothetical protein